MAEARRSPAEGRSPGDGGVSIWVFRGIVTLLTLGIAWRVIQIAPMLDSVPVDLERRFESTWLNLIFAGYANLLAQFVVWKVGHRSEGRNLSVFLGSYSVCLALSVAPTGEIDPVVGGLFASFWTATILLSWRFWATFPSRMDAAALRRLAVVPSRSSWFGMPNRLVARVVGAVLKGGWPRLFFVLVAAAFGYEIVNAGSDHYNLLVHASYEFNNWHKGVLTVTALISIMVSVGFAWTAYLLADADGRRRVLWVVLAQLVIACWSALATAFYLLSGVTQSPPVLFGSWLFNRTHTPLTLMVNLTGFAVAIFYSGALDLRPLINRTTVYGAAVVLATVIFAGVEELVQSQLAVRLGIPGGAAGWIGAAVVALGAGPIHMRLGRFVRRLGSELERSGSG